MVKPTSWAFLLAGITLSSAANAQSLEASMGGEFWKANEIKGHATLLVRGQTSVGTTNLIAEFNTDTLTFRAEKPVGPWTYALQVRGEALIAGLLSDYYIGGDNVPERTFYASYLEVQTDAKRGFGDHYVNVSAALQRWYFQKADATGADLVLPPEAYVLKQRLGWTYWDLADDPSWYEAHRSGRRRIRGIALGVEGGIDYRSQVHAWGAAQDPRNDPQRAIFTLRQWAAAGVEWTPGWRLQVRQWAGVGAGEDDLTRTRLGGMNPYVVTIPGLPWAAFLASRYAAAELSQAMKIAGDLEIGFTGNAAYVEDTSRTANFDQFSPLIGTSAFLDWRSGDWQVNAALGASPDTGSLSRELILSMYVDVGFSF